MGKRILSFLLAVILCLSMLPMDAFAAETPQEPEVIDVGNTAAWESITLDECTDGCKGHIFTGTKITNGQGSQHVINVYGNHDITFRNLYVDASAEGDLNTDLHTTPIYFPDGSAVTLEGSNTLIGGGGGMGIFVQGDLKISGTGTLNVSGDFLGINIAAADLTVTGGTIFASEISGDTSYENCVIFPYGNKGQVYGNAVLGADFTIPSGITLTVPEDATLTIQEGATLENNGTIQNEGTITNNGTFVSTDSDTEGTGTGTITGGGAIEGNGERYAFMVTAEVTTIGGENETDGGTVSGTGVFTSEETTTLTATANDGYEFVGWKDKEGSFLNPDDPTADITVSKASKVKDYTAEFVRVYDIWIAGKQVTADNQSDVTGDGTVYFEQYGQDMNLYLSSAKINCSGVSEDYHGAAIYTTGNLNIILNGDNEVATDGEAAIYSGAGLHFLGATMSSAGLTATGGDYGVYAGTGIGIDSGAFTFKGSQSAVNTAPELSASLYDRVAAGEDEASAVTYDILDMDKNWNYKYVSISPLETYGVWVAGVPITKKNQEDVLGDKTVSYNSDTDTLSFNNASIVSELNPFGIESRKSLTIELTGSNTITGSPIGIWSEALDIIGKGEGASLKSASIICANGVGSDGTLQIENASLEVTAGAGMGHAIVGKEISIHGGNVEITAENQGIMSTDICIYDGNLTVTLYGNRKDYNGVGIFAENDFTILDGEVTVTAEGENRFNDGIETRDLYVHGGELNVTAKGGIEFNRGILATNIDIQGGKVTVAAEGESGIQSGIENSGGRVNIQGGEVIATAKGASGSKYGIWNDGGSVNIQGGKVTATAEGASGYKYGIWSGAGSVSIQGGEVTATAKGAGNVNHGIYAETGVSILYGTVTAGADEATESFGIFGGQGIEIGGGNVTASGGQAMNYQPDLSKHPGYTLYQGGSIDGSDKASVSKDANGALVDYNTASKYVQATGTEAYYPVWIGGTVITDENKTDVLGDGTVQYDSDSNTLMLNNANITGSSAAGHHGAGIYVIGNLNIALTGENTVENGSYTGDMSAAIFAEAGLTFTGQGSLVTVQNTEADSYYGISAVDILMEGGDVTGSGETGIAALESIMVKDGSLTGKGNSGGDYSEGIFSWNITVEGGELAGSGGQATNQSDGIICIEDFHVKKGSVQAIGGSAASSNGISVGGGMNPEDNSNTLGGSMNIQGGSITATGGEASDESRGIHLINTIPVISGGILEAASGSGTVSSAIESAPDFTDYKLPMVTVGESQTGAAEWDGSAELSTYKYVKVEPRFTVDYDANGGSGGTMETQIFRNEVSQQLAPNAFARQGYTFAGWNTKADGSGTAYTDKQSIIVTGDMTLYAQWTANTDTAYRVEHYFQNLTDNGYTKDEAATQNLTGTTDQLSNAKPLPREGFTPQEVTQVNIAPDGSTVVKIYYNHNHRGGTANCISKAVCEVCRSEYGELDNGKHGTTEVRNNKAVTETEAGYTGDTYCKVCNTMLTKGTAIPATGSEHMHVYGDNWQSDSNGHWHTCSCGAGSDITAHSGGTATCTGKAVCEVCRSEYGELDNSKHGTTEVRNDKVATETEAGYTGDTYCKDCNTMLTEGTVIPATGSEHAHVYGDNWQSDSNGHWHICSCGAGSDIIAHSGGTATCSRKAICEACRSEYGELDNSSHGITEVRNNKAATETEAGYTGDTYCRDCNTKIEEGKAIPATGKADTDKPDTDKPDTDKPDTDKTDTDKPATDKDVKKDDPVTPAPEKYAVGTSHTDDKNQAVYTITKAGINDGTVEYKEPVNKKAGKITIPETVTIGGITYKVTGIAKNAFKNNKKLKKITIGKNIETIGANAFRGCKKLKNIIIKTEKLSKNKVGKNAFKGIYAKAKIKVPKKMLKSYKSLLKARGVSKKAIIKK